ncbi:MAG: PIN domain-containing protein [Thaumarchaeota archaeon]|nr:PIN domain-containing protein [Nitrososphaerota archaeon]
MSRTVVLDTGVIAEYIDLSGTLHQQAEAIIESVRLGKLTAIITHPTLAETYYVSLRIYEKLGLAGSERRSQELVTWLYSSPNFKIAEPTLRLAILAGQIKTNFQVALTDAYVIAASQIYNGKPLFRKRESEMAKNISRLKKDYDILFLED